ncbi:hypothetical protein V8D89_013393 [Ganoderma adspersum]
MADHIEESTTRAMVRARRQPADDGVAQIIVSNLERCREYAAHLPPIADQDLPPALLSNPAYLLHYGFTCPMPYYEGEPGKDLDAQSIAIVRSVGRKIEHVNEAVKVTPRLDLAFTITDTLRKGHIIMLALYSSDTPDLKLPRYTEAKIERIREELSKAFGAVGEPMWHWDEYLHGAATFRFRPFAEAYPHGNPALCQSWEARAYAFML